MSLLNRQRNRSLPAKDGTRLSNSRLPMKNKLGVCIVVSLLLQAAV